MNIDELTTEELIEIKKGLNEIVRNRYTYMIADMIAEKNLKRKELNEKYIKMDNKLIKIFIEEIDKRKEDE